MQFLYALTIWLCCIRSCFIAALSDCHDHERSALLDFKKSFLLDRSASLEPNARLKVDSWKPEVKDCCIWDGVECSEGNGYVIGLDVSSSFLFGFINSTSSLFSLVHLRRLNLADNNFNLSQIPPEISRLSKLSRLNLSSSVFSGQIPMELLGLSNLVSLDLGFDLDRMSSKPRLRLEPSMFTSLVHKLNQLKILSLRSVFINSTVPEAMANMSSLTHLILQDCGLYGEFPKSIFLAPNLQAITLNFNENLTGALPDFHQRSPLQLLSLAYTGFYGSLPDSLANLTELNCFIPCFTNINRGGLSWLGKLSKLSILCLTGLNLQEELPVSITNLTQLISLTLSKSHLTGRIPSWLFNLTQLEQIELSFNDIHGQIESSFSQLRNLKYLAIQGNNLRGEVEADVFLQLRELHVLLLSENNISFVINNATANATLAKFTLVALGSCNLREFPDFLQYQENLQVLSLSNNMIDKIPKWMWDKKKPAIGFDHNPVLPWANLFIFDLRSNLLEGTMPIPPPPIAYYYVSNNRLTGKIPAMICSYRFLSAFDLSNNKMSGTIPPCLGNLTNSLQVLNLKGNNFHGNIPPACGEGSRLQTLDLSRNQLQGPLPRSLANCEMLEILLLENNQIEDSYPFWLGSLSNLQVLILSSNKFHGNLAGPLTSFDFPKLRIIDLSNNSLTGSLRQNYFLSWNGMKDLSVNATYMQLVATVSVSNQFLEGSYAYSMQITNKGVKTEYEKILNIFTAIDLSSNKFTGEIPGSFGRLYGLQLLNLSNNRMVGSIPSSIANLAQLESLDLSQNSFSGGIPQQLEQLNFLAFLNVSSNNLSGPIPQGKQFDTFLNGSYMGNSALCGEPLSRKCSSQEPPRGPQASIADVGSELLSGVDWIVLFSGVASGLAVGFIFATNLSIKKHEWFVEKFGKRPKKWKSIRLLGR